MRKLNFKLLAGAILPLMIATSCVKDGFGRENEWEIPSLACNNKFGEPTISMAEFVKLAPSTEGSKIVITDDHIFDGYVISSDENGTFYKSISFQDKPENPTVGLQIEIDKSSLYADFPVGSRIRIKAKGLVLAKDRGVVKLGAVDNTYTVGRITSSTLSNYVAKACNTDGKADIVEIKPIVLTSLTQAKNEKYINQLVSVPNIQFADSDVLGAEPKTYLNLSPKADTNRELVDADNSTATLRLSQYISFGAEKLPAGSGEITFVVSKYNTNYQIFIRGTHDVKFTNERIDIAPAKGGTNLTYQTPNTENFESYATGASSEAIDKYINDPVVGNRYWRVATFDNNKYIQFGYSSRGDKPYAKTYFAIPVDFDVMQALSFKTKDGFNTGNVLKVYYSTDYKANAINATLNEITSSFTIATGAKTGYASTFTESGEWQKPADLKGKGFIIFEYEGGGDKPTTTMQIDDIIIR